MKGLYFDNLRVCEDLWTLDIAWIRRSEGQTHQAVGLLWASTYYIQEVAGDVKQVSMIILSLCVCLKLSGCYVIRVIYPHTSTKH